MNVIESIVGNKMDMLSSITSNFKNMFEAGQMKNDDEESDEELNEEFDEEIDEELAELAVGVNTCTKVKPTSRVVVPVRNGNVTVVVPTDKEEKRNLINKINSLLPNTADKVATEKLNSHTIEELEVFYKQLQGKADALSEEGEFDLD